MFKTRVVVLLVLTALAFIIAGLWSLGSARDTVVDVLKRQAASSRPALMRAHRIREANQLLIGRAVETSELGVALEVLEELRDDIIKVATSNKAPEKEKKVGRKRRGGSADRYRTSEGINLGDLFVARYVDKLEKRFGDRFFEGVDINEFQKKEKKRFEECVAIDVAQCYWDYTYNTLQVVLWKISKRQNAPVDSRIIVTDVRGVGLADSKRPRWSASKGFAEKLGLPAKVLKDGGDSPVQELLLMNDRLYLATALPISHRGVTVGSVVVADPLDDKMARDISDMVGAEVTYTIGAEVVASSLDEAIVSDIVENPMKVGERVSAYFSAFEEHSPTSGLKVYISKNIKEALAGFNTARTMLLMLSVFLGLLGVGLLLWCLRSFYRAFEMLDTGIHEVINGNLDYQFPFEFREEISHDIGQSLNLMSLVLQGRPLPEEVEEASMSWANDIHVLEPELDRAAGPTQTSPTSMFVEGVDSAALGEESADVYYKRVYQEFVDARTTLDLPVDGINYPKFMERLVRLEQGLKKKHKCAMVRFVVSTKDNEVVLIPVPINR